MFNYFTMIIRKYLNVLKPSPKTIFTQHYTRSVYVVKCFVEKIKCNNDEDVDDHCAITDLNILSLFFFLCLSLPPCLTVRRAAWRSCCQGCSRRWTPSVPSWRYCGAHHWSSRDSGTSWGSRGRIWRCSWHASAQRPKEGTTWGRENDHYTTHIPSPVIVFKPRLFRVQISNTCHSPAGNAPRWHLDENVNDLHCITALMQEENFFFPLLEGFFCFKKFD